MIPPSKRQSNIENPDTPLTGANLAAAVGYSGGYGGFGGPTKSKQTVTANNGWEYSAVYAAISLLSNTIAQLPLVLYQKKGRDREPAVDHWAYRLVHDEPSDLLTSFKWRQIQQSWTLSWGNGYAYLPRYGNSVEIESIYMLDSSQTEPVVLQDGSLVYVTKIGSQQYEIAPKDIIHISTISRCPYRGLSPITLHKETIGLSQAATEFGATFFGNGTGIGGVLTHPDSLSPDARRKLADAWTRFKGDGYTGTVLLDEGLKYDRIGIPPNDAQFLETRKFQVSDIARIYNIPPHMLRDLEKSSFNNIAEQSIEFLRYSLTPWLATWEQELNRKILPLADRKAGYYFKFNTAGLLRSTYSERSEAYASAIASGWMNRNEVRELEDLNPAEGLDEYLVPLNMVNSDDAETAGDEPEPEPDPAAARSMDSFQSWLAESLRKSDPVTRINSKLDAMLARYVTPHLSSNDPADFTAWLLAQPLDDIAELDYLGKVTELNHGT